MRLVLIILVVILAALQYVLWFGKGGVADVNQLEANVAELEQENEVLKNRNEALRAEVENLREGSEAIEERARTELGLIGPDEEFYQVVMPPAESAPDSGG